MIWPIVLPFTITFWILVVIVVLVTAFAPALKWRRGKTFGIIFLLCCLAFIPSCVGIMAVVDAQRFGVFQYESYADLKDFRVERYLPTQARKITLEKFAAGHRAKYSISKLELTEYLDDLWDRFGQHSAFSRDELDDGANISANSYERIFGDLGWPVFDALEFHSPVQGDGGGATYYFDPETDTEYHRAGYW